MTTRGTRWLNRGNTRNVILVLCMAAVALNPQPGWQVVPAALLLMIGIALHILVKGSLVRNTMLCRTGPYRLARHPYYLANYLVDSGFCLVTGSPYLLALLPFLFFWGYGPSLRREEEYLSRLYGEDYDCFVAATPQILPDGTEIPSLSALCGHFSGGRITPNEVRRVVRFSGAFLGLVALQYCMAGVRDGMGLRQAVQTGPADEFGITAVVMLLGAWLLRWPRQVPEGAPEEAPRAAPAPTRTGH